MTGGIGFVSSGKDSNRKNRGFLKHTDKVMSKKAEGKEGWHPRPKYKESTKEEVDKIMKKFNMENRKDKRKQIVLGLAVCGILFYIFYLILW